MTASSSPALLLPMAVLALWTLHVLIVVPIRRVRAGRAGLVSPEDFRLGESERVPEFVKVPNRNFMNLLELPVLFYVVGLMYYVAGRVDQTALVLAWAYVALRAIHSAIHLSYNNVVHRLTAYALSNAVLAAFWIVFFI